MPYATTDIHDVRNDDDHADEFSFPPLLTVAIAAGTSLLGWTGIVMGIRAILM